MIRARESRANYADFSFDDDDEDFVYSFARPTHANSAINPMVEDEKERERKDEEDYLNSADTNSREVPLNLSQIVFIIFILLLNLPYETLTPQTLRAALLSLLSESSQTTTSAISSANSSQASRRSPTSSDSN